MSFMHVQTLVLEVVNHQNHLVMFLLRITPHFAAPGHPVERNTPKCLKQQESERLFLQIWLIVHIKAQYPVESLRNYSQNVRV